MPTVLIVDHNFDDRRILTSILEFYGFRVETAPSAAEGMESARALRPDLIIINIHLPDASGLETAKLLRADAAIGGTPMLCISNHEVRDKNPRDYGCSEILTAPFSPPELIAAVRRNVGIPNAS